MGTANCAMGVPARHAGMFLTCLMAFTPLLRAGTSDETDAGNAYAMGAGKDIREKCQSCRITMVTKEVISGRLHDVSYDSLGVMTTRRTGKGPFGGDAYSSFLETVPLDDVSSVECGDPVWDGAVWGFVVGGLPLAFMGALISVALKEPGYEYDNNTTLNAAGIGLGIGGTAGLLVGLFFDSATGSREKEIAKERLVREWTGY